ncbi:MAG TPA: peptide ABC transporter substrate-binding protein [Chloroflexi bacterium]|nr:peptide ABC transporter substrate-binding protein [Chloroflexota bacterium]
MKTKPPFTVRVGQLLGLSLLVVVVVLLAACAGQATPQTVEKVVTQVVEKQVTTVVEKEVTTVVEKEKVVEVTPTPGPRVLTIGMNELVTSLDPPTDWAIAATWIHMNIFDCLVWRNRETAEFEPFLAESWENINDTTWRFKLRQGVKFHNGEDFNADAVVWTYQRILDDSTMITYNQWTFIKEINVLDPYEVEIVTNNPEPAFLSKMAGTGCGIQAPKHGKEMADKGGEYTPVGTGPFKFVEWAKDDHITLAANDDYWRGKPEVDTLIWRAIPETSTRVANLITGDVDLVVSVPPQDWDRVNENPGTRVKKFLTTQVMLLALRTGPSEKYPEWTGLTSNAKIRQAIGYAIDRQALVDLIDGMGVPVLSRITPPTLGWDEKFYNQVGEYDPEKARQLLDEAGYAGEELVFQSSTSWLNQKEVSEAIAAMLQAVGLNVNLQVLDVTTFREQVYFPYHNEEIYMDALGNSFFDPWITVLSERSDRRERSGWSGPLADEADKLIREAAVDMDPDSRREKYVKVQELINEDVPYIYLYQMYDTVGLSDKVEWEPPLDGFLWMGNVKWRE